MKCLFVFLIFVFWATASYAEPQKIDPASTDAPPSRVDEFEDTHDAQEHLEEVPAEESPEILEQKDNPTYNKPKETKKSRYGKVSKETEGTTAPNRFKKDIINKSYYELKGEPLEVDTD